MKKVVIFVVLMMIFGLTACNSRKEENIAAVSESADQSTKQQESAEKNLKESPSEEEESLFEAPVERMSIQNNVMQENRFHEEGTKNQQLEEYLGQQGKENPYEDVLILVQTAIGYLDEMDSMLDQMLYCAEASASGAYSDQQRSEMQQEFESLRGEIERICETASCDGRQLFADNTEVAVEVDSEPGMTIELEAMSTSLLNMEKDSISIAAPETASEAIDKIREAIDLVSSKRSNLNACKNKLEHSMSNMP